MFAVGRIGQPVSSQGNNIGISKPSPMQLMEQDSLVSDSLRVELTGQGKGCIVVGTDQEVGMLPVGRVQGYFFFFHATPPLRGGAGAQLTHRCLYLTQYMLIRRVGKFYRLLIRMCGSL